MNPSQNTALTSTTAYPTGLDATKESQYTRKFVADVYQGDCSTTLRFSNSLKYTAGANHPTGSIVYRDGTTNKAVAGVVKGADSNHPVPCLVIQGTDRKTIQSQEGNSAGGTITVIPVTCYARVYTTVFDTVPTYKSGDLLTAKTATVNGLSGVGVATNGAVPYTDVVLGIVENPVAKDHCDLDTLTFTMFYLPAGE